MSKIRLIQCGLGGMGRVWRGATSRSEDFELLAVVDIARDVLEEAGDELCIASQRRFLTLEDALQHVQADAVLTVTPPAVHVEHARLAFARGRHLLTEKPIAQSVADAKEMVELARSADRQLVVAQNRRFLPQARALQKLMATQHLGPLGHGHVDFYIPADFTGTFRATMQYPLLVDMAIHHFDLIRFVTGREITRVSTLSFNPAWSWYGHDSGAKLLLELSGGIPFSYSGDWSGRGKATGWSGDWRLQCEQGSLHLENETIIEHRSERWNKNPQQRTIPLEAPQQDEQALLLASFAEAIRTNRPAETSGADNLLSFGAVMAAVASARENRPVEVKEVLR